MAELRKDYFLDRYVIIARERAKRPDQFIEKLLEVNSHPVVDYFAPGNEHLTPPEKGHIEEPWKMRWFENKFSAVDDKYDTELSKNLRTDNNFYTFAKAFGIHEVIVETNDSRQQWDLSEDELFELLKVYSLRIKELSMKEGISYVQIFKNHGQKAGCSVLHSHSQVIALNIIPPEVESEEKFVLDYKKTNHSDPFDDLLKKEKNSEREIYLDDNIFSFCPYASRFSFEVRIMPLRDVKNIVDLSEKELKSIVKSLKMVLEKLKRLNVSYNFFLRNGKNHQRFYIEVLPRTNVWAGFELSTGIVINPLSPEDAAKYYKEK